MCRRRILGLHHSSEPLESAERPGSRAAEGRRLNPVVRRSESLPCGCGNARLLYDLIHLQQQRLGNLEPKRLRGLEIDDELELGGLFDREIGGPRALENPDVISTLA